MKFLPQNTNIVFVGNAGLGENFGQIAPQLKLFDVYYTQPPVVGFHVVGEEEDG